MTFPEPTADRPLLLLVGETAVGKSDLALALAERAGAAIVSMDSMQVYRGMDVGTAKPSLAERERVEHFGLDLVEPHELYDVQRYLQDAGRALETLTARGVPALFVGGTGFYLKALLAGVFAGPPTDPAIRERLRIRALEQGAGAMHAELQRLDPAAAERIHPHDEKRVLRALEVLEQTGRPISKWQREAGWGVPGGANALRPHRLVGLRRDPATLEARILARTERMLDGGWDAEVRRIQGTGGFSASSIQALGYREVMEWVAGRATRPDTEARIALKTRQFARRQRTWFRKFEHLAWIDADGPRVLEELEARLFRA